MVTKVLEEFDYMFKDTVCSHVRVLSNDKVEVEDFVEDFTMRAFGRWSDRANRDDADNLLRERCFPETRGNMKELMSDIGLDYYSPRAIINVTHGVMVHDFFWIRYESEKDLTWSEVSKILG